MSAAAGALRLAPMPINDTRPLAVWFPAVRSGSGADVFTERLAGALESRGVRCAITWLAHRAEYAPFSVQRPRPPAWATVAHVNSWLPPSFLPRGLPTVATIHHAMHDAELRPHKGYARTMYHRHWIAPQERKALARASRVVAVSRHAADEARRILLDVPIEIIPNAVDTDFFRPRPRDAVPGEVFRLLYLGRWREMKGVRLLGPLARTLGPDYRIDVTGMPDDRSVADGLPPNVHDIGVQRDSSAVIEALQRADALIVPSLSEGFGLVVIEAMACGVPVIASRLPSLQEVIEDGESGVLCKPGAVEEFAQAARALRTSEALRASIGARARQRAVQKFGIDAMVDAYLCVYQQAMDPAAESVRLGS